jgi:kinetochore protein NDC80
MRNGALPKNTHIPDDRPLRERAHQAVMLKAINDFLREQGKEGGLRSHPTPSAKEFQDTFLFIYNITFDDDRVPGAKKMDEEVVELLRVVRYPWIDSLSKLPFTIITPHVWPHLLGTLHWMVQIHNVGYHRRL